MSHALPIGTALPGWTPPPVPPRDVMTGRHCRLEPISAERHGPQLHAAYGADREGRLWTYLAYGPFASEAEYVDWLRPRESSKDPLFFAVVDAASGRALGVATYLRIEPPNGSIEVGHIAYAPELQHTPASTEAMYLMMREVFRLGYRRYEWKCDALNAASRAAALRLGFTFEGIFRQATVYKGRNRDTAWFSIIDREWPRAQDAFERWLDPSNFDRAGRQRASLAALR